MKFVARKSKNWLLNLQRHSKLAQHKSSNPLQSKISRLKRKGRDRPIGRQKMSEDDITTFQ